MFEWIICFSPQLAESYGVLVGNPGVYGRYGFANHAYSHLLHRLGSLVFLYGPDSSENIKKETAKDEPLFVIMVYSVVLFILFEFETMILYFNTRLLQEETA